MTRFTRLVAGAAAAFTLVFAAAGPAAAHATLEQTDPTEGSVLAVAPTQVAAQFDESVGVSADSLRVYSPTGARVDDGTTTTGAGPDVIVVDLRSGLGRGTYTVAWHVISADTHPVSGAFTFSIGVPSRTTVNSAAIITRAGRAEGVLFGAARFAGYLVYALLAGAVFFLAWCWPRGAATRAARRTVAAGWTGLLLVSFAQLMLQGVYASALPLTRAMDPAVINATLATRFGTAIEIRLLLLGAAGPILATRLKRFATMTPRARLRATAITLVYTVALAATWAGIGHASTGIQTPLAVVSDLVHLTAMAVWLGGLAVLGLLVLRSPDKPKQAARAVVRFSPVAFTCVSAIVLTGTYQAWRDVGSLHALADSTYGRLVLLKILGVLALIALGYYARNRIAHSLLPLLETSTTAGAANAPAANAEEQPADPAEPPDTERQPTAAVPAQPHRGSARIDTGFTSRHPGRRTALIGPRPRVTSSADQITASARAGLRRLRWSVTAETVIVLGVLALTAILVDSVPGRTATGIPNQPAATDVSVPFNTGTVSGTVLVVVEPGLLGPDQAHLLFEGPNGQPYSPAQVTAEFKLPTQNIGPLPAALTPDSAGHYVSAVVSLGFTGTWQLVLTIRSDNFNETTLNIPVTISSG